MNKKWAKELWKGVKPAGVDSMTAKEIIHSPIIHMFAAKLYVTAPWGCLKIEEEIEVGSSTTKTKE